MGVYCLAVEPSSLHFHSCPGKCFRHFCLGLEDDSSGLLKLNGIDSGRPFPFGNFLGDFGNARRLQQKAHECGISDCKGSFDSSGLDLHALHRSDYAYFQAGFSHGHFPEHFLGKFHGLNQQHCLRRKENHKRGKSPEPFDPDDSFQNHHSLQSAPVHKHSADSSCDKSYDAYGCRNAGRGQWNGILRACFPQLCQLHQGNRRNHLHRLCGYDSEHRDSGG